MPLRWLVTVIVALPSPTLPTTRRPLLIELIFAPENAPSEMLRVEGAVATRRKEEFEGMCKLILPLVVVKR